MRLKEIKSKRPPRSVYYNSVNMSMTISGFSQMVENTSSVTINYQGNLLLTIKRPRIDNETNLILIPVIGVSTAPAGHTSDHLVVSLCEEYALIFLESIAKS